MARSYRRSTIYHLPSTRQRAGPRATWRLCSRYLATQPANLRSQTVHYQADSKPTDVLALPTREIVPQRQRPTSHGDAEEKSPTGYGLVRGRSGRG